jgi:hypothetical protein
VKKSESAATTAHTTRAVTLDVPTAALLKTRDFRNVTPCSSRRFEGRQCLRLRCHAVYDPEDEGNAIVRNVGTTWYHIPEVFSLPLSGRGCRSVPSCNKTLLCQSHTHMHGTVLSQSNPVASSRLFCCCAPKSLPHHRCFDTTNTK